MRAGRCPLELCDACPDAMQPSSFGADDGVVQCGKSPDVI